MGVREEQYVSLVCIVHKYCCEITEIGLFIVSCQFIYQKDRGCEN